MTEKLMSSTDSSEEGARSPVETLMRHASVKTSPELAGDEHLRRKSVVNVGAATEDENEEVERSLRTRRLPG
jgi:hypothetical protein